MDRYSAMKRLKMSGFLIEHSKNTDLNEVINNPNCTFLGTRCDQPFTAFYVWEKFFNAHGRHIKRFLELGCDMGGTSVYFALWCQNLKADYYGFDYRRKEVFSNTPIKKLIELDKKIIRGNLYGEKISQQVIELMESRGMTVVFSDCIDKPWEFNTFAPHLKHGDVMAVHDWDRAIKEEWVHKTLNAISPFEILYEKERMKLNTLTRFFLKE